MSHLYIQSNFPLSTFMFVIELMARLGNVQMSHTCDSSSRSFSAVSTSHSRVYAVLHFLWTFVLSAFCTSLNFWSPRHLLDFTNVKNPLSFNGIQGFSSDIGLSQIKYFSTGDAIFIYRCNKVRRKQINHDCCCFSANAIYSYQQPGKQYGALQLSQSFLAEKQPLVSL